MNWTRSFLARLAAALPLPVCLASIAVLWLAHEFYPLSHFPMYSDFTSYDYVVFVTNQDGEPLPLEWVTGGIRTARLKKHFNTGLNRIRKSQSSDGGPAPTRRELAPSQLEPAGRESLEWLLPSILGANRLPEGTTGLGIHLISVSVENGRFSQSPPARIATLELPKAAPAPPSP